MGKRKIIVKRTVAKSIAEAAWYIESKGMVATAENFAGSVYNFFQELSNQKKEFIGRIKSLNEQHLDSNALISKIPCCVH